MHHNLQDIAGALKQARVRKALNQRALSKLSGVPQGQISKIENGAVDLRASSLIELARALDLELMLVPRRALPAVDALVRPPTGDTLPKAAYSLDEAPDG